MQQLKADVTKQIRSWQYGNYYAANRSHRSKIEQKTFIKSMLKVF